MRWVIPFIRLLSISRLAIVGASIVTAFFLTDLFLFLWQLLSPGEHPYGGIVVYMILPNFIVLGLVMIPIGLALRLRKLRRRLSLKLVQRLMRFGVLQRPGAALKTIALLTLINIVAFSILGYRGYQYMDSTAFCGRVCHSVMDPEYSAYQRSPHSQVECVQCHIGPGATWFVKSKISGAWQVVSVTFNLYERPIPTPVKNLRPAREVCETCHRPERFAGNLIRVIRHYQPDQNNTVTYTVLNMRVGGGGDNLHEASGIHWHVAANHQLRYYASDSHREKIQWIEDVAADGSRRVWTRPGSTINEADLDSSKIRTMDCLDCHNRPTHIFLPPIQAIEDAMTAGRLDPTVPWIRKVAEKVIIQPFATQEDAMRGIADQTRQTYQQEYPDVWKAEQPRIEKAITVLQQIHKENVFPSMNINWNTYPLEIGHPTAEAARCFRCHDGLFRDNNGQGKAVTLGCDSCHYVLAADSRDPSVLWLLQRDTRLYGTQPAQPPAMPKP